MPFFWLLRDPYCKCSQKSNLHRLIQDILPICLMIGNARHLLEVPQKRPTCSIRSLFPPATERRFTFTFLFLQIALWSFSSFLEIKNPKLPGKKNTRIPFVQGKQGLIEQVYTISASIFLKRSGHFGSVKFA